MEYKSWTSKKLGEVITLKRGYDLPLKKRIAGRYPILSSSGISDFHNEFKVEGPGVTTGRSGLLGKVYYVDEPYWPLNTSLYVEDFKGNEPKFIYYLLQTIGLENYNAGSSVPTLNRNHVHLLDIKIPTVEIQKRIGDFLYNFEKKIALNENVISNLEQLGQTLFKRWFVDYEFPNENGEPYKSSGGEMVESELGRIPASWLIKTLDEVTEMIIDHRGKTPKKLGGDWSDSGYAAISAKNIKRNRLVNFESIKYLEKEMYEKWMKNELEKGDILLTSEGPLGEMLFLAEKETFCLSQRLYAIRANKQVVMPEILFMFMNTPIYVDDLFSRATGSTVQGIRQSELRKTRILIPDIKYQKELNNLISPLLLKVFSLGKENTKLTNLRDTLLQKLLSGEIELPDETEVTENVPVS